MFCVLTTLRQTLMETMQRTHKGIHEEQSVFIKILKYAIVQQVGHRPNCSSRRTTKCMD